MGDDPTQAVFEAIDEGDVDLVRTLIERDTALANSRNADGLTPLMSAVSSFERKLECVDFLLEAGADVTAETADGWTALHFAVDAVGEQSTGEWPKRFCSALFEAGAKLEVEVSYGATPLMLAVLQGDPNEATTLLELGADPNCTFPEHALPAFLAGHTLLEAPYALPNGPEFLKGLLAGGADPRRKNSDGLTAREAGEETLAHPDEDMDEEFLARVKSCIEILREAESG